MILSCGIRDIVNKKISVITVNYNDSKGLEKTLESLAKATTHPYEVIVVDGASSDASVEIANKYQESLNLKIISERDLGIYDAMNKGKKIARGELLHYLNSGDFIYGDPYLAVEEPCILKTKIINPDTQKEYYDFIKFRGYGYNHQGIIFPSQHLNYNLKYSIAADLEVIISTFKKGLNKLPVASHGGACFFLGGASSIKSKESGKEFRSIISKSELNLLDKLIILALVNIKNIFPRFIRRPVAYFFNKKSTSD